jgi:hypothetical protein
VNIAAASRIMLGNDSSTEREAIHVLLVKEKAEAMLTEARKGKEEIRREREKNLQIVNVEGGKSECEVKDIRE